MDTKETINATSVANRLKEQLERLKSCDGDYEKSCALALSDWLAMVERGYLTHAGLLAIDESLRPLEGKDGQP